MDRSAGERTAGEYLKLHSDQFQHYDWEYTRKSGIESIYYTYDYNPYEKPSNRLRRALKWLLGPSPKWIRVLDGQKNIFQHIAHRVGMFAHVIKRDKSVPDGSISDKIIVYWEEDGEYLQLVQPSVGSLLADFLVAEPSNPHAIKIAAEIDRIRNKYGERVANGEVCDCSKCKSSAAEI